MICERAKRILRRYYLCDNCLGRLFAQLLTGLSNAERGRAIRTVLALEYEARPFHIKIENLIGFKFRSKVEKAEKVKCFVCGNLFERIDDIAKDMLSKAKRFEYHTFVVGSKISQNILENEDKVIKAAGIEWYEPIKLELNRELGKAIEKKTGKKADERRPDLLMMYDKGRIDIEPQPLYIYGMYKKLVSGIPQTEKEGYRQSIQSILSRPALRMTKGKKTYFHGMGREDIDVRCLTGRPFVLEIKKPVKRSISLAVLRNEINKSKKIKVSALRFCDRSDIVKIKTLQPDKSYRAIIETDKEIDSKILKRLTKLNRIRQRTPKRVLKRRPDIIRERYVKDVKWRIIGKRRFELVIRAQAGLYVKEMITGDGGRTTPSVSSILGMSAKPLKLDVIKIWL
ncbi:MAG: tRNA pseudouridine(54/55) synthase Pus10 [Candidatus Aenigmatarchaeota archaeon]